MSEEVSERICPLLSLKHWPDNVKCLGIKCAWWDTIERKCAILSIGIGVMDPVRKKEVIY